VALELELGRVRLSSPLKVAAVSKKVERNETEIRTLQAEQAAAEARQLHDEVAALLAEQQLTRTQLADARRERDEALAAGQQALASAHAATEKKAKRVLSPPVVPSLRLPVKGLDGTTLISEPGAFLLDDTIKLYK